MKSFGSILLQTLIVVLFSSCAEPVVLSAAPSGIATGEDQTLRPAPNAFTRCAPGELLVKWKEGPDSPAATLGNAQIGSTVQRNFHEIGWQQVKLPCELSVQEGIARYRALGSVSAVEPNYAVAPILPPRRDAADPVASVGNTGVLPSVEDGAPGSTDQLPTPHSALRTSAPTPIIPNDPMFGQQWALKKIGLTNAWAVTTGSSNVVVAVIDTGITYNHQDLAANMWRNPGETGLDANGHDKATNGIDDDGNGVVDDVYGVDAASDGRGNDSDPLDEGFLNAASSRRYHGTACAGIIGAVGNNGKGLAGVNWSVQLMAIRCQTTNNINSVADTIAGYEYVIMMKRRGVNVRVTNNSYFIDPLGVNSQALKDAIDAAGDEGILNVFAANNQGVNIDQADSFPQRGDSPSVVCVAASDQSDQLASFSNFGRTGVDLAAPGVNITAPWGPKINTYISDFDGTSAACPMVVGTAALLLAANPGLSVDELKAALFGSVDQPASMKGKLVTNGRLNAARALAYLTNSNPSAIVIYAAPGGPRTATNAPIQVTFNRPMNQTSVESALVITPPVSGVFEWSSDRRKFTYRHDTPFDSTTNYTVRILGKAQDAVGGTLDGNFNGTGEGSPNDDFIWTFGFAIPNDDFANAQWLTGASGSVPGSNRFSWLELDEPNHVLGEYELVANSVWYRWTAPEPGAWATFDLTSGTSFDSLLAIYSGDQLSQLASIAGNDNYGRKAGSRISFTAAAGTTYSIAVAGKDLLDLLNPSKAGSFTLAWYPTPQPGFTDDQFSPAHASAGATVTLTGTNFTGATSVSFNGAIATFTNALKNYLDLQITAIVPPAATSGPIIVLTPHGSVTSTNLFDVLPPPLTARLTGGKELEIAWPATSSAFVLEVSADLNAGSWLPVAQSPVVANGQSSLKLAPGSRNWFYRLRRN